MSGGVGASGGSNSFRNVEFEQISEAKDKSERTIKGTITYEVKTPEGGTETKTRTFTLKVWGEGDEKLQEMQDNVLKMLDKMGRSSKAGGLDTLREVEGSAESLKNRKFTSVKTTDHSHKIKGSEARQTLNKLAKIGQKCFSGEAEGRSRSHSLSTQRPKSFEIERDEEGFTYVKNRGGPPKERTLLSFGAPQNLYEESEISEDVVEVPEDKGNVEEQTIPVEPDLNTIEFTEELPQEEAVEAAPMRLAIKPEDLKKQEKILKAFKKAHSNAPPQHLAVNAQKVEKSERVGDQEYQVDNLTCSLEEHLNDKNPSVNDSLKLGLEILEGYQELHQSGFVKGSVSLDDVGMYRNEEGKLTAKVHNFKEVKAIKKGPLYEREVVDLGKILATIVFAEANKGNQDVELTGNLNRDCTIAYMHAATGKSPPDPGAENLLKFHECISEMVNLDDAISTIRKMLPNE